MNALLITGSKNIKSLHYVCIEQRNRCQNAKAKTCGMVYHVIDSCGKLDWSGWNKSSCRKEKRLVLPAHKFLHHFLKSLNASLIRSHLYLAALCNLFHLNILASSINQLALEDSILTISFPESCSLIQLMGLGLMPKLFFCLLPLASLCTLPLYA